LKIYQFVGLVSAICSFVVAAYLCFNRAGASESAAALPLPTSAPRFPPSLVGGLESPCSRLLGVWVTWKIAFWDSGNWQVRYEKGGPRFPMACQPNFTLFKPLKYFKF